jgi:hypothetical protein
MGVFSSVRSVFRDSRLRSVFRDSRLRSVFRGSRLRSVFRGFGTASARVLESGSLRIVLPPKWEVRRDATRASARGPDGEILKITSFSISGDNPTEELPEIRAEVVAKLRRTIEQTAGEDVFKEFSGITEEQTPSATLVFAALKSKERGFSFWQYGLVGPAAGLHANCQFPPGAASAETILAAVKAVEWKSADRAPIKL